MPKRSPCGRNRGARRQRDELLSDRASRKAALVSIGFNSYLDYLNSDLWRGIRARRFAISKRCVGCGKRATQIHHCGYSAEILLGKRMDELSPVCGCCHKKIEFGRKGRKVPVREANKKLRMIRAATMTAKVAMSPPRYDGKVAAEGVD